MKRKIAAVLCSVLCLGAFTGCSTDELGYLQMSVDMMQNMEQSETKGSVEIAMDLEGLQRFVQTLAASQGVAASVSDVVGQEALVEWKGTKNIKLNYTMQMDLEKMAYIFDIDAVYEGKTYSFGNWYYSIVDGIYISTETVDSVYQMMQDLDVMPADSVFASAEYKKELQAMLKKDAYICLMNPADMGLTKEELQAQLPQDGFKDLYQSVFDLYKNAFDGFSTNMVTKIENGYHIEADGTQVGQMLVGLLDYMAQNPEKVMDALENYMVAALKYDTQTNSVADLQDAFAEMRENWEETSALLHSIKTVVEDTFAQEAVAKAMSGFHYSADVKKANDGYTLAETYTLAQDGKEILSINSNSTTKANHTKVTVPTTSVTVEQMQEKLADLENKYNPVTGLSITWMPEDEDQMAWTTLERVESAVFTNDFDSLEYVVQDGRIYLPLRTTCDLLGEHIVWDKESRTAFVEQDGKKIRLDSRLIDGTSYIGVRGLEVAGYAVDYSKEDGVHTAVLSK